MNTSTKVLLALLMPACFICRNLQAQNIFPATGAAGIGTTSPKASSLLEVKSTTKGILIPRMTIAQRNAIVSPVKGLLIFQTDSTNGFFYYSGSAWKAVSAMGANKALSNLTAPTAVNKSLLPGTTGTLDLGSSANLWRNAYFSGDALINGLTVGLGNGGSGSNTALGYQALNTNTTGTDNTAAGYQALQLNTSGAYNVATGVFALHSNTSGSYNNAYGNAALTVNTSGSANNAFGFYSLYANSTGNYNVAYGYQSLYSNSAGNNNSAFGTNALYSNSTGYSNVAIGNSSLFKNTSGSNLVAVGDSALFNQTVNSNGYANTAIGSKALYSNTIGYHNTANGYQALNYNTTGVNNTAAGYQALYNNNGTSNTANGTQSLYSNTTGVANTSNGVGALYANNAGSFNTANGFYALSSNTTGNQNIADGFNALLSNTTGNYNTALGVGADVSSGDLINATSLGNAAIADASNKVRIGNTSVKSIGGQVSWTTFSDGRYKKNIKEDVKGLSFINSLKPVTYTVDVNGLNEYFDKAKKHDSTYERRKAAMQPSAEEAAKIVYNGFIAQDVERAAQSIGYNFSGVDKPRTKDGLYGLRYSDFVVPLVKAVQELSNQNEKLKNQNEDLEQRVAKLEAVMNARSSTASSKIPIISMGSASIEQNIPNPFSNSTVINYILPPKFSAAQIIITDKAGKVLKQVPVSGIGKGFVQINAATLSSGAYQYSLSVDGKIIATRQMILAK